MYKIVTVLKSGGEYNHTHVRLLADSLIAHNPTKRLTVLSDVDITHPYVDVVRMVDCFPKWWCKIELFNHFKGRVLYFDLDTVITGNVDNLMTKALFTMLPNVYYPGDVGSGVMAWHGDYSYLYDKFKEHSQHYMDCYRTPHAWGDQGYIRDNLGFEPERFGANVRSYKAQLTKGLVPRNTDVVYFHGKPKPWEVVLRYA